jgi:hypothetical protein
MKTSLTNGKKVQEVAQGSGMIKGMATFSGGKADRITACHCFSMIRFM